MTVTSPASGARAPHRRSTRRLLATGLAVVLSLGVAGPAAATTPTPEPSPSATALSGTRELTVVPGSTGTVRAGQPLTFSISLANGQPSASDPAEVTVSLGAQAIADRGALEAWLASENPDPGAQDVATTSVARAAPGEDATASVILAADDPVIAGRAPGVYTVRASAVIDGQPLSARSVVVVPAESTTPIAVAVPITAGPPAAGLLGAEDLERLTAPDGALTAQLGAVEGTAAILAVDPAIPAAIRVLGTSAPPSATEWLERLLSLPNSRFALQFGDADVATQVQAGLPVPLGPTSLLAYMQPTDFAAATDETATASPSPSPSASPAPDGPEFPDLSTLLDIGGDPRPAAFWPAAGSAGADVVAALGALAVGGTAPTTLLASTSTTAGEGGGTVSAAASAAGAGVLVYDAQASADLGTGVDADDPETRANALVAATAHLAFASADTAGRPLLVTVGRGEDRSRTELRGAIAAALQASGAGTVSLEQLLATPAEPVTVVEVPADLDRTADTTLLMGDERAIADFATILDDPQLLTGPQRAEILQLLSVAWRADPNAADEAIAAHRAATAETLDAVGVVSTNVVLVSYGSEGFRPYVRNDLPYPVNLTLAATSDTSSLGVGARTPVAAQPGSNTLVSLPIEARIANATAVVSMQLYGPTGVAVGAIESATVEVHAEWETIGLVILGALMVLFVTGGVIRTVMRRRSRGQTETADAAASDDPHASPHPEARP